MSDYRPGTTTAGVDPTDPPAAAPAPSETPVRVVWQGGRRFSGGPIGGPSAVLDGSREAGPSPVDSLVAALASCAAIDVVEILEKRRTPAASLAVHAEFSRAVTPPRRLTQVHLRFRIATASERPHVERAVQLSFDKYCSVASSLAPDLELGWSVDLDHAPSAGERS